ncbi:Mini-ribonuclease 3 [Anaeroarcus burkinensis]|uniref:Mini-ribonuclease 3 n=1 Tax=Anaeroarcus burkinensis TaxID=82376 RepID=UPI000407997E|nr:ribonuclease III domain-containing protein [Anaeroarcus burkinensis]
MKFSQFQFLKERLLQDAGGEPALTEAAHPLVLAYVGDAYYTLYVRLRLLEKEQRQVRVVHEAGMRLVSAVYQSKAYEALKEDLTEAEGTVARRGRNTKASVPKSASVKEYRQSTALEALFGYLLLSGQEERLEQLAEQSFEIAFAALQAGKEGKDECK